MNIEDLKEIYNKESTNKNIETYILIITNNFCKDPVYQFVKGYKMEPFKFYPSAKVLDNSENNVIIIFGISSLEIGFIPTPIKIGKLVISYYFQKVITDELFFETDLKTIDNIYIFEKFRSNFKNITVLYYFSERRFFKLLNILNWCCPFFDSIDGNKIWSGIDIFDEIFYKEKHELYLNSIYDLKWQYRCTNRFSHSEGTIYNFSSELILPKNEYVRYLIENIINIKIYETDVVYSDLESEKIGYEHLNKARLLAFTNYDHSKYVLSLIRNYEKYPFNTIKIDIE
jgi:hypothetical protein